MLSQLLHGLRKIAPILARRFSWADRKWEDEFELAAVLFRIGLPQLALRMVQKRDIDSRYAFTNEDILLHLKERNWTMPTIRIVGELGNLVRVAIEDVEIYWPRKFDTSELAWLWCEIFQPFDINPSSYADPRIPFRDLPWVVDGGACEGFFTEFCRRKGVASLLCVEMQPPLIEALKDTFIAQPNIVPISGGLAATLGNAFIEEGQYICDAKLGQQLPDSPLEVQCVTLDYLQDVYDLKGKGLVKLDVEGAEMDVLSGATNLLRDLKPYLAIAVYHGYDNAIRCAEIVRSANPYYEVWFRGCYGYFDPPRPYIMFAA